MSATGIINRSQFFFCFFLLFAFEKHRDDQYTISQFTKTVSLICFSNYFLLSPYYVAYTVHIKCIWQMFKCIMPLSFSVFSLGCSFWLFTICKLCHWLHVKDVYSFLQMCRCVYLADVQLIVVCYAFSHTSVLGKTPKTQSSLQTGREASLCSKH